MPSEKSLTKTITSDYLPNFKRGYYNITRHARPYFSLHMVPEILMDPRIIFGMWMIKGPIVANSRFFVDTEEEDIKEYIIEAITRFWRNSAARVLKALEWGYSGSEVLYRYDEGLIKFDTTKDIDSLDCRAVTLNGKIVGFHVKGRSQDNSTITNRYVGGMKALWHVHRREIHPWYGRSRLWSSYIPWWEKWNDGGYRDMRRLFFYKYAFDGGTLYHPPGSAKLDTGETVTYKNLAMQMIDQKRSGGTFTLPNTSNDGTNRDWEHVQPTAHDAPTTLLEYGKSLDDEELEGLCIPPEVMAADGTGAFAGRRVPQQAFYSILQELTNWLITDFDDQVIRPAVEFNFGADHRYEIKPFGLQEEVEGGGEGRDDNLPHEQPQEFAHRNGKPKGEYQDLLWDR